MATLPVRAICTLVVLVFVINDPRNCLAERDSLARPNLVFLMADDQCTYSMGCYGTPNVRTPHLDRLARDGIVFERHYDTTAICMASRVNVMTGKFEYKHGCNFEHGPLLVDHWRKSYPVQLRESGYVTAFAGKFGFEVVDTVGSAKYLPNSDFDLWGGGPGQTFYATERNETIARYADRYPHSTRAYGAFGSDFIGDAAEGDQPFCLSISFKAPHRPVSPDPIDDAIYRGGHFIKPDNFGRDHGAHFSMQSRQGRQYIRFHQWQYSSSYDEVMARYYQQVYAIDVAVGMIRDALDEHGVADNTVIIYTSDNGFMCGSHGYGSKVLPYEEASRVPLIVYDPRHENSGKRLRCGALTGNVDFAPTLLELAGIERSHDMDGRSLLSLYDDPTSATHTWLPLINVWGPDEVHSLSVVTRDWKYIVWPYSEGDFRRTEELYSIAADPLELENRIADRQATQMLRRMRGYFESSVSHWRENAVGYHNYRPFADVFAP